MDAVIVDMVAVCIIKIASLNLLNSHANFAKHHPSLSDFKVSRTIPRTERQGQGQDQWVDRKSQGRDQGLLLS